MNSIRENALRPSFFIGLLGLVLTLGCGPNHYRKSADREAAQVIREKSSAVRNMDPAFGLTQEKALSLDHLSKNTALDEALGDDREVEKDAAILSLDEALSVAVKYSRDYLTQKEVLYLAALDLTLARHRYTPIFSGGGGARVENQPREVLKAVDNAANGSGTLIQQETKIVQDYRLVGDSSAGFSLLLRSGARLLTSFNIDFLRFLNGDPRWAVNSSLSGTLTQPLLRGAGYKVTMENLTQAERSMLYALRTFTQYRKDFAVRIAQSYYGVLRDKDAVRNSWKSYQSFTSTADRQRALAEEGRIPLSDLGQIVQGTLNAESGWIGAVRNYRRNLDQFKILLGLPTDARVILEDQELAQLQILHPQLTPEQATEVALRTRLDLATAMNRQEDAERQVGIAANSLKGELNLVATGTLNNREGSTNPLDLDTQRAQGSVGANLLLPLDRKAERNQYRAALIHKEQSVRQYELLRDTIRLQVDESWRSLDQAKRDFEIKGKGVELAERRVEDQEIRAELGRLSGLELVDAKNALLSSQNEKTAALVNHTIARLQFWNNMGILYIKDTGKWEELDENKLE